LDRIRVLTALLVATGLLSAAAAAAQGPVPGTSFATAPELQPGTYSFHLQPGDLHFFRITLKQGQTLFVTLRMASDVDFDIVVLSPERDLLESGVRPVGFYERISLKAPVTGSYYIVVYPFGASSGSYTLELSIVDEPKVTATVTVTEFRYITVAVPAMTVTREVMTVRTVAQQVVEDRGPMLNLFGMVVIAVGLVVASVVVSGSLVRSRVPPQAGEKTEVRPQGEGGGA
jgi:hypothetical protein